MPQLRAPDVTDNREMRPFCAGQGGFIPGSANPCSFAAGAQSRCAHPRGRDQPSQGYGTARQDRAPAGENRRFHPGMNPPVLRGRRLPRGGGGLPAACFPLPRPEARSAGIRRPILSWQSLRPRLKDRIMVSVAPGCRPEKPIDPRSSPRSGNLPGPRARIGTNLRAELQPCSMSRGCAPTGRDFLRNRT